MKKGYVAYNLTDEAHIELLSRFPSKFPVVVAHHVTIAFNVSEDYELPEKPEVRVVGYACNEKIECVVVEVNGSKTRESDGKLYHVTLSHLPTAKAVESNNLLQEEGYSPVENFTLDTIPTFNGF